MTRVLKQRVECAKCGKESYHNMVLSVNGDLESRKGVRKLFRLVSRKQVCPHCKYKALDIGEKKK